MVPPLPATTLRRAVLPTPIALASITTATIGAATTPLLAPAAREPRSAMHVPRPSFLAARAPWRRSPPGWLTRETKH